MQVICRELCSNVKVHWECFPHKNTKSRLHEPYNPDPGLFLRLRPNILLLLVDIPSPTYQQLCVTCAHHTVHWNNCRCFNSSLYHPDCFTTAITTTQLLGSLSSLTSQHFNFCFSSAGPSDCSIGTSLVVHIPVIWFGSIAFLFTGHRPVIVSHHLTSYFPYLTMLSLDYCEISDIMEVDSLPNTTPHCGTSPITTTNTTPPPGSPSRVRVSMPTVADFSTTPKRRRINTESSYSGSCDSPLNISVDVVSDVQSGETPINISLGLKDFSDGNHSVSPCGSPLAFRSACAKADFCGMYKKDELWASIRSDYHYIMDKEIIETCKVSLLKYILKLTR